MTDSGHGLHQSAWERGKLGVLLLEPSELVFAKGEKMLSAIAYFMANLGVKLRFMDQPAGDLKCRFVKLPSVTLASRREQFSASRILHDYFST